MPNPRPRGRPRVRPYTAHDGRHVRLAAAAARHALIVFRQALRDEPGVCAYVSAHVPRFEGWLLAEYGLAVGALCDVVDVLAPAGPVKAEPTGEPKGSLDGAGSTHRR